MHVISIYNNKGGVGKSTLTVGLAEFLAGNRKQRVLVIDMDAQASSSGALLGRRLIIEAISQKRTIATMAGEVLRTKRVLRRLSDFVTKRPASTSRGTALEEISLLVPDKASIIELEEGMRHVHDGVAFRDYVKPALQAEFDFVLVDLPGNVDKRNKLVVSALVMSDFVLIPAEPSQISLNAIPDTFDLIQHSRALGGNGRPAVIGMVLNKTDKRTEQYRHKFPSIIEEAGRGGLPPLFDNFLPDTPKLATATDETIDFHTLKDRFDTYYDHVRKVARELEERCNAFVFKQVADPPRFGQRFREILARFGSRK